MPLFTPGPTIGVVGGGQLGRMLGEAAAPLGLEVVVVDPATEAPAAPVVSDHIEGDFGDEAALAELARRSDVLTYEIELADPDTIQRVAAEADVPVHPDPDTLRVIQDKLVQKRTLSDAGIPVPAFQAVESVQDLRRACQELGYPVMLKAREGGYDGRGNYPVENPGDERQAFEAIGGTDTPAMAEAFVDYERELAVMACQGAGEDGTGEGETAAFPVTETIHEAEILRETISPARASEAVRDRAREVALTVVDALDGRGVFGVELFETPDGDVLFNEVAPRPHNSGHWTIEGAHTSQFEQHLRAVTGRPLGAATRRAPTASKNILGEVDERRRATCTGEDDVFATDRAHLHWYGKREVYDLRKMGHVTLVGQDDAAAPALLATVRDLVDGMTFR
jgi:5-(carboxyamino)imidazole ribonucleotide synthase